MRTLRPLAFPITALLFTIGSTVSTHAQTSILYQAPTGPNGTWTLYEYVLGGTTFKAAQTASAGIANPLGGPILGNLTEIGNAFENTAINQMTYRGDAWIGLTDRVGVTATGTEGNFQWTNGALVNFLNWNPGEPNDAGGEDAVHMGGGGGWNDNKSGYGVDDPVANPSNLDETAAPNFRYIREWNTASVTPLAGVRSAEALSFDGSVATRAPASTVGNFGVREITGLTLEGNLYDTVNKVLSGAGTFTEAQRPRLDATDPESNAAGGPIITTPPLPFLTDAVGTNEDNIITVANGKLVVPSSGTWTIQVRSDDGFALRMVGQTFTSVAGAGQIDPLDPSTILFYGGTGDSNTRGVVTLAAGTYDMEFVHWEGGGGAYYEVTTAKGAHSAVAGVQWLAMGDSSVLPTPNALLRLTGDVTVRTAGENTGGGTTANSIPEARALLTAAETAGVTNNSTAIAVRIGDGQPEPFPAGTPADEFATKALGSFILNDGDATAAEPFTITFGIFSDDGSQLRILGQDFDLVNDFSPDGIAALVDVGGDMSLTADYFTGNTNAFGRITLLEGTYNFETIMFEGGGGANLQVFYSVGDKTGTGLDSSFVPLSALIAANEGWAVVPEPSTALLTLMGGAFVALRRRRK